MSYYEIELSVGTRRMCAVLYMKGEKWRSMVQNVDQEIERGKGHRFIIPYWAHMASLNSIATDIDKICYLNTPPGKCQDNILKLGATISNHCLLSYFLSYGHACCANLRKAPVGSTMSVVQHVSFCLTKITTKSSKIAECGLFTWNVEEVDSSVC